MVNERVENELAENQLVENELLEMNLNDFNDLNKFKFIGGFIYEVQHVLWTA